MKKFRKGDKIKLKYLPGQTGEIINTEKGNFVKWDNPKIEVFSVPDEQLALDLTKLKFLTISRVKQLESSIGLLSNITEKMRIETDSGEVLSNLSELQHELAILNERRKEILLIFEHEIVD